MVEREVKLAVDESYTLPDLGYRSGIEVTAAPERILVATYYDSADLRLAAWGITLRFRSGDDAPDKWTLKLPARVSGPLMARHEVTFPGVRDQPPGAVLDSVAAILRGSRLTPVAVLTTRRLRHALHGPDGQQIAEVDDDRVTVQPEKGSPARTFREIELELAEAAPEDVATDVTALLQATGARAEPPVPKLLRALGLSAATGPEPRSPALNAVATGRDVLRAAIATAVRRLIGHDPYVRLDLDPEAIHQARVAARRLRSQLAAFKALLSPEWVDAIRGDLRWVSRGLAEVRDRDVLAARFSSQAANLPEDDRGVVGRLVALLRDERRRAWTSLLGQLRSPRYMGLLNSLVTAADDLPVENGDAEAIAMLLPCWHLAWRRLADAVADLPAVPAASDLHRVRIRSKRARYVTEALLPVGGRFARRLARALAGLQGQLGELQDAAMAEAWLRGRAQCGSLARAVVVGELVAEQRAASAAAASTWRQKWKRAVGIELPRWLKDAAGS